MAGSIRKRSWTCSVAIALIVCFSSPARAQTNIYDPNVIRNQAEQLCRDGKESEAVALFDSAVRAAPLNAHMWATAGWFLQTHGTPDQAYYCAKQAVRLRSDWPWYVALAARTACTARHIDQALSYAQSTLQFGDRARTSDIDQAKYVLEHYSPKAFAITLDLDFSQGKVDKDGYGLFPMPMKQLYGQDAATYSISGAADVKVAKNGDVDYLSIKPLPGSHVVLNMNVTVHPFSLRNQIDAATEQGKYGKELTPYMGTSEPLDRRWEERTPKVNPSSVLCLGIARTLLRDTTVDEVDAILDYMKKNFQYEAQSRDYYELQTSESVLQSNKGVCSGASAAFVALCRARHIPARIVYGYEISDTAPPGHLDLHNWAEVFLNGVGWVQVDPQRRYSFGCLPTDIIRLAPDTGYKGFPEDSSPLAFLVKIGARSPSYTMQRTQ